MDIVKTSKLYDQLNIPITLKANRQANYIMFIKTKNIS